MPTIAQLIEEGKRLGIVGLFSYGKAELVCMVREAQLREKAKKLGIIGIHMMNKSVLTEVVEAKERKFLSEIPISERPVLTEVPEVGLLCIIPNRKKRTYVRREIGAPKKKQIYKKCKHGKREYICVECGGKGMCVHGKQKYNCVPCDGPGVCEHKTTRFSCKICKGTGYCEHGMRKSRCIPCGAPAYCEHGKRRYLCLICGGKGRCVHDNPKQQCSICEENKKNAVANN